MKTLKLVFVLAALVFASCADKDEAPAPEPTPVGPSIEYETTSFEVDFFTDGNSAIPSINWNGDVGTISTSKYISGMYVNESNGVVHWQKRLPLGISEFSVVATNSEGQQTINMVIENIFHGNFEGEYNHDHNSTTLNGEDYFKVEFLEDGSLKVSDSGFAGEGTWTRDGDQVTAVYKYGSLNEFKIIADLEYGSSRATLKGHWYKNNVIEGYLDIRID